MTRRIMLIGHAFSGKTTQGLTMPVPALACAFDPKTRLALAPSKEWEVKEFFPKAYDTHVRTLDGTEPAGNPPAAAMEEFNKALQAGIKDGSWARYKTIMLDYTFMEMLIQEAILTDRGRDMLTPNKGNVKKSTSGDDKRDDYQPVKSTALSIVAQMAYLGPNFIMCCHLQEKNKLDAEGNILEGQSTKQLNAIGTLRTSFPSFFDTVLYLYTSHDSSKAKYMARTRATGSYPGLGIIAPGAADIGPEFDMTIDWKMPLQDQGLGKLLKMTGGVE